MPGATANRASALVEQILWYSRSQRGKRLPVELDRIFSSLDHITQGRVAWNIVTSLTQSEAQNFGHDNHLDHEFRYERADEFVRTTLELWSSWDPDALVLVARNIHHSVVNALKAFGLDFRFLPAPYDARFEAVLPPRAEQVMDGFRRHPEALAVIYTSPTYEGLAANTAEIADAVHDFSPTALVIVDEAWGGHLHFHPELPASAMAALR